MRGRAARRAVLWLAAILALCALPAAGQTVQYVYDELGRLIAVIDGGSTTLYSYDAAGNLLSVSNLSASQFTIFSFSPGSGPVGASVTISGSGFIADPQQNTVRFAGTQASVISATATAIVATVPVGAATGPISVSNANGSATSAASFSVVAPPTVAAVTPDTVARAFITRVQISGTNLRFATLVTFAQAGITAAIAPGASDQSLPVDLSVSAGVPAGAYPFTVANAAGSTGSGSVTVTVGARVTGDVMSATPATSVFLPHPLLAPPTAGDSLSVSRTTSIFLPQSAQSPPPAGDAMSVSATTSVFLPHPAQVAPTSGDAMSVGGPVSVSMP